MFIRQLAKTAFFPCTLSFSKWQTQAQQYELTVLVQPHQQYCMPVKYVCLQGINRRGIPIDARIPSSGCAPDSDGPSLIRRTKPYKDKNEAMAGQSANNHQAVEISNATGDPCLNDQGGFRFFGQPFASIWLDDQPLEKTLGRCAVGSIYGQIGFPRAGLTTSIVRANQELQVCFVQGLQRHEVLCSCDIKQAAWLLTVGSRVKFNGNQGFRHKVCWQTRLQTKCSKLQGGSFSCWQIGAF